MCFLGCADQDRHGYTNICGQHHSVATHLSKSLFLHPPVYTVQSPNTDTGMYFGSTQGFIQRAHRTDK